MEKDDFLLIGKIVGVHGVMGVVKVYSYAESLSVFKPNRLIRVTDPKGIEKTHIVDWVKPHKRIILLSLKGIESLGMAKTLVGSELFIEKEKLSEPEEGTYFWFDIIGLCVYTSDGDYIGRVESIISTGSNDVYVVKNHGKYPDKDAEILIPAIESVVVGIDLENKRMEVNLPEGL